MLAKVVLAATLVLAGLAASAAPAAAEGFIACPTEQIRREVTTPLPGGWWQTPSVGRLTNTEVTPIGGQPTLVCRYGETGSVMLLQPDNNTCEAVRGGFECRVRLRIPPIGGLLAIQASGTVDLRQTFALDLDSGAETRRGADVWYQAVTERQKYLSPMAPARMSLGTGRPVGLSGCRSARYSDVNISLSDLPVGTHACVLTGDGRYSEIRVDGFRGTTMSLSYTTWR